MTNPASARPADVTIGRLGINAGAMSEGDARRLAELVGLALGRVPNLPSSGDVGSVNVNVPSQAGRTLGEIADTIANAIAAALRAEAVS